MRPYSASLRVVDTSGRVLYIRRSRTETRSGTYEHPAGRIEPGEHPAAAALREVHEETGITIPPWRLMLVRTEDGPKGRHYVYTARVMRDTPVRLSAHHDDYEWRVETYLRVTPYTTAPKARPPTTQPHTGTADRENPPPPAI